EAAEQLTQAERVQNQDGKRGEDYGGQDGGDVDPVLAPEGPQRQRQGPLVGALGEDQGQQESVPDGQGVENGHGEDGGPGERRRQPPQRRPLGGAVDPHRVEQLLGDVADEVGEHQHGQRNGEGDRRQDQRQ